MGQLYDTTSDVRHGTDVPFPTIAETDSFILIKMEGEEDARVSLFNLTPSEALDALMGVAMALNG